MPNPVSKYKERCIKKSIQRPFQRPLPPETKEYPYDKPSPHPAIISFLWALLTEFWALFTVYLRFNAPNIFRKLRKHWGIDEEAYRKSFQEIDTLSGPMGFSGASFFRTHDKKYLLKSLNRSFEYRYYYNNLLLPLAEYQLSHPSSYIVHITDCLFTSSPRLGHLLGTSPSHFLIMENIQNTTTPNDDSQTEEEDWEDYDLKPSDYFFPERDFMGGLLASEETKKKLHDVFEGQVPFTRITFESIMRQLKEDSEFLCQMEVVDYSLFMIRRKHKKGRERVGILDANEEWEYKFSILDIFTSTRMARTKAMKVGVKALGHSDMTITAKPEKYREDWLRMISENLRMVDGEEEKRSSGDTLR